MLNQFVIAGRMVSLEKDILTVSIPLPKKDGEEPKCTLIPFICPKGLLKTVKKYVSKGDVVGIKGRLENNDGSIICITEKISFLSSKRCPDNEE